jgi:polyhydroxyalkanoate synthesis regulator phasin
MQESLKKVFLTLVGAAAITAEKADEIIADLVKKGEITVEESKKMASELQEKGQVAQEEFSKKLKTEVETTMNKFGYVKKEDMDKIREELDALKAQMSPKSEE